MRIIVLLLFVFCTSSHLLSQELDSESLKYWFYRDRLKYFVYPGAEEGASVLMTSRNAYNSDGCLLQFNGAEWGQTRKINGYYLGLLATEYKLLLENGQNEDAFRTLHELDLALSALIRMDECENIPPWNFSIGYNNGFFLRNDVPPILSQEMTSSLNQGLSTGDYWSYVDEYENGRRGYPFEIKPEVVSCARKYESESNYFYINHDGSADNFSNILLEYNQNNEKYWKYWKSDKFTSNDEIIGTLMGLAIVARFVDDSQVKNKAIFIAQILRSFAAGTDPLQPYQMFYPDGEKIKIKNGGNSFALYNGIDNCVRVMEGHSATSLMGLFYYQSALLFNCTGWPATMNRGMYIKLVATSDYATGLPPNYAIKKLSDTDRWDVFYSLMWAAMFGKDLTRPKYDYDFWQLLFDLEQAPCGGPHKHCNNCDYYSEGWACEYKYDSEYASQYLGGVRTGVFPGVDYMLLYNLACLAFPDGFDYEGQHYSFPYYFNQINRTVTDKYAPLVVPGSPSLEISSTNNPEEMRAIRTITSDMIVSNRAQLQLPMQNQSDTYIDGVFGDMTLKAGESIKLTDGFRVDAGAHFLARIESYGCNDVPYINPAAPLWSENYRGSYYDTLISVPMDQRAPNVGTKL